MGSMNKRTGTLCGTSLLASTECDLIKFILVYVLTSCKSMLILYSTTKEVVSTYE